MWGIWHMESYKTFSILYIRLFATRAEVQ